MVTGSLSDPRVVLWTVGHSNHHPDRFLTLLDEAGIQQVVDVRSHPASRFQPAFNRTPLQHQLETAGITYRFDGDRLGGRPRDRSFYDAEGHVRYDQLAQTAWFTDAVDELVEAARQDRTAVMCSEGDPSCCHRRLLVARVAAQRPGVTICHVLPDGALRSEDTVLLPGELDQMFPPPWRSLHPAPPTR